MQLRSTSRPRWVSFLERFRGELALFLLVLASHLGVLSYAGSPLPYYDQWLAEFSNTFLRLSGGASAVDVLLTPHNEHLLLTSKLLSLLGFLCNGYWDVRFLQVASAVVRATEAAVVLWMLRGSATSDLATDDFRRGSGWAVTIWITCAVLFATPVSAYNSLCGLQVSFYLAELATLAAILCVVRWNTPWRSGAMVVASTAFGLLSLGSAVAIPAATLVCHGVCRRSRPGFWPAWTMTALLTALYVVLALRAQEVALALPPLGTRLGAFLALIGWPYHSVAVGALLLLGGLAGAFRRWRQRVVCDGALPVLWALAAYAVSNVLLIALNRPPSDFHPRHWDTITLIPFCVFLILAAECLRLRRPWGLLMIALLALGLGGGLAMRVGEVGWPYLQSARRYRAEAVEHYRNLLLSGQLAAERSRMNQALAARDYAFFDDPLGRFALPPVVIRNILVNRPAALALLSPEIIPVRPLSACSSLLLGLVRYWWLPLIPAGLLLVRSTRATTGPGESHPDANAPE